MTDYQEPIKETPVQDHPEPPKKRHKGVAGAILSTALDAALFTSALGYAAYQFWTGNRLEEDEKECGLHLSPNSGHPQFTSSPPPPPYQPRPPAVQRPGRKQPPPSHAGRRARLRSLTSRLPSSRLTSSRPPSHFSQPTTARQPISLAPRPSPHPPQPNRTMEPQRTAGEFLMADFVCSLGPYVPPPLDQSLQAEEEEAEGEGDDDPDMRAFKAQIRGLILEGQTALASRPTIHDLPHHSAQSQQRNISHNQLSSTSIAPTTTANNRQLDENLKLLQLALDKASSKPQLNWWER